MLQAITTPDIVAIGLVAALAFVGLVQGAARKLVGFVFFLLALAVAVPWGRRLGAEGWPVVRGMPNAESVGMALGTAIVFLAVSLLGVIIGLMVRSLVRAIQLGSYDRVVGLLVGALEGGLLAVLLCVGVLATDFQGMAEETRGSAIFAATRRLVVAADGLFPPDFDAWLRGLLGVA